MALQIVYKSLRSLIAVRYEVKRTEDSARSDYKITDIYFQIIIDEMNNY